MKKNINLAEVKSLIDVAEKINQNLYEESGEIFSVEVNCKQALDFQIELMDLLLTTSMNVESIVKKIKQIQSDLDVER